MMIDLKVLVKNGKIGTNYNDKECTLNEVSLLVYELQRIIKFLLEKTYEVDYSYTDVEGDDE